MSSGDGSWRSSWADEGDGARHERCAPQRRRRGRQQRPQPRQWDWRWQGGWSSGGRARRWRAGDGESRSAEREARGASGGASGCEGCCGRAGWLFVQNLPGGVRPAALEDVFASFGKVKKVCVMNARSSNKPACAFVQYLFSCEAKLAIRMLHGKHEMQPGHGPITLKVNTPGIFVDNLPVHIKEELVDYLFSFYGKVKTVHIATGHSRRGRACAFVEFSSAVEAESARSALQENPDMAGAGRMQPGAPAGALEMDVGCFGDLAATGDEDSDGSAAEEETMAESGGQGQSQSLCVICMALPPTHAFVPCGHRCVCADCAKVVTEQPFAACPICRMAVERALQIFC